MQNNNHKSLTKYVHSCKLKAIRERAFKEEGKTNGIEELKKKIEFMLQTMDQQGLEQAYKILQRIWIRHGTQQ